MPGRPDTFGRTPPGSEPVSSSPNYLTNCAPLFGIAPKTNSTTTCFAEVDSQDSEMAAAPSEPSVNSSLPEAARELKNDIAKSVIGPGLQMKAVNAVTLLLACAIAVTMWFPLVRRHSLAGPSRVAAAHRMAQSARTLFRRSFIWLSVKGQRGENEVVSLTIFCVSELSLKRHNI